MRKIYKGTSFSSKFINSIMFFCQDKKHFSTDLSIQKYIKNINNDKYILPSRLHLNLEKMFNMDIYNYDYSNQNKKRAVIYVHGGSYIEQAKIFQINFARKIAKKTNSKFYFPIYPLAPKGSCKKVVNLMRKFYQKIENEYDEIIFLGDSAGGGFILSFAMYLRDNGIKQPKHIIMLSPWLDISMSNVKIYGKEKKDFICGIEGNRYAGKLWADDLSIIDPLVSPIYGNFNDLGKITIITGEREILSYDCYLLDEKLIKNNIEHNFIEYYGQGHDFGAYPTKEGKMVINDIVNIINGE